MFPPTTTTADGPAHKIRSNRSDPIESGTTSLGQVLWVWLVYFILFIYVGGEVCLTHRGGGAAKRTTWPHTPRFQFETIRNHSKQFETIRNNSKSNSADRRLAMINAKDSRTIFAKYSQNIRKSFVPPYVNSPMCETLSTWPVTASGPSPHFVSRPCLQSKKDQSIAGMYIQSRHMYVPKLQLHRCPFPSRHAHRR